MVDARMEQMISERSSRERDLVLSPNEYAYVSDTTKGHVNIYMGPYKVSLASTDRLVRFDKKTKTFVEVKVAAEAISLLCTAPENWYISLKNPAKDGTHPRPGSSAHSVELDVGKKVNIPGPVSFALWPMQMSEIIRGHHLNSNQYLVAEIYDLTEQEKFGFSLNRRGEMINIAGKKPAEKSSPSSTSKSEQQSKEGKEKDKDAKKKEAAKAAQEHLHDDEEIDTDPVDFVVGQKFIIKGTDLSFYIPPTGIKILPDENGEHVRDAVTLERLEYCILLGEDGQKEYVRGARVVFPRPNQQFVRQGIEIKYKAIELSEISGLYIKIISPYKDEETGKEYREGEELFLTGKDKIYFPNNKHAIISYNGQQRVHSIAIPPGEGRYVLNRKTGEIRLVKGPKMLLPDPRSEVIVRRILSDKECGLLYPLNREVLDFNRSLIEKEEEDDERQLAVANSLESSISNARGYGVKALAATTRLVADTFNRPNKYTSPRTLVLNEKFEGAVSVNIWSGYAAQIVRKDGTRRVAMGPANILLEYDEMLDYMSLSTGKPKSNNGVMKDTAYLMVTGNKVSDIIEATTRDLVNVKITLKYRLNFEGEDPSKWFSVSNYVQLLCDHARSRVKSEIKKENINRLRLNYTEIIRDCILGHKAKDADRPGMLFAENSMRVFDVEVLELQIADENVRRILMQAQNETINAEVDCYKKEAQSEYLQKASLLNRKIANEESDTQKEVLRIQGELEIAQSALLMNKQANQAELDLARLNAQKAALLKRKEIQELELELERERNALKLEHEQALQSLHVERLEHETDAVKEILGSISPNLSSAINRLSETQMLGHLTENFAELAVIEGKSLNAMAQKFLVDSPFAKILQLKNEEPLEG